jgi:hypothetical protein
LPYNVLSAENKHFVVPYTLGVTNNKWSFSQYKNPRSELMSSLKPNGQNEMAGAFYFFDLEKGFFYTCLNINRLQVRNWSTSRSGTFIPRIHFKH